VYRLAYVLNPYLLIMATSKPQKLTRAQIQQGLDSMPIESLLSSGKGKTPQLTHKQREFARAIALGQTKAQAYRGAYKENPAPSTIVNAPYILARDSRIVQEVEAYKLALEAEKHRTPAQLKALLVQQLVQHSLDDDFPPAQRVQCLKLLGSLFEVGAFIERKEIITINKSTDIRARLLSVLGGNVQDITAKDYNAVIDDGASLLAELAAGGPVDMVDLDPNPTGDPTFSLGPQDLSTHTVSDKQSQENPSEDSFDSP
jgi:hypothetical protein